MGIRCNFDIRDGRISRFGFDAEATSFDDVFRRVRRVARLVGLHCHYSTDARSTESFRVRTQKLVALTRKYFGKETPEERYKRWTEGKLSEHNKKDISRFCRAPIKLT